MAAAAAPAQEMIWLGFVEKGEGLDKVGQWIQFPLAETRAEHLLAHLHHRLRVPVMLLRAVRMSLDDRELPAGVSLAEHGIRGPNAQVHMHMLQPDDPRFYQPLYDSDVLADLIISEEPPKRRVRSVGASKFMQAIADEDFELALQDLEARPDAWKDTDKNNNGALSSAVTSGHLPLVRRMLELQADPNTLDHPNAEPVLYMAARLKNAPDMLRLLHEMKADLKIQYVTSLLESCCMFGSEEAVLTLLELKADIPPVHADRNILSIAVGTGKTRIVEALIAAGCDPNFHTETNLTPLRMSLRFENNAEAILKLLELKADPAISDTEAEASQVPLVGMAAQRQPRVLQALLDLKADVNLINTNPQLPTSPLVAAISGPNLESIRVLLEAKADPNRLGENVYPLELASTRKDPLMALAISEALLEAGADPNLCSRPPEDEQVTALVHAVNHHNLPLVKLLLAAGAKTNPGKLTLPLACLALDGGGLDMVKVLLAAGAGHDHQPSMMYFAEDEEQVLYLKDELGLNLDQPYEGMTPLSYNVLRERLGPVQALLAAKADANVMGPNNIALITHAANKSPELLQLMLLHGADPNPGGDMSPLHLLAAQTRFEEFFMMLVNGADHMAKDKDGATVFEFLGANGFPEEALQRLVTQVERLMVAKRDGRVQEFLAEEAARAQLDGDFDASQ